MKIIYEILKAIMWLNIGIFIGNVICEYSYRIHYPNIFAVQSAPWYVTVLPHSILTIAITVIISILMVVIKKKTGK